MSVDGPGAHLPKNASATATTTKITTSDDGTVRAAPAAGTPGCRSSLKNNLTTTSDRAPAPPHATTAKHHVLQNSLEGEVLSSRGSPPTPPTGAVLASRERLSSAAGTKKQQLPSAASSSSSTYIFLPVSLRMEGDKVLQLDLNVNPGNIVTAAGPGPGPCTGPPASVHHGSMTLTNGDGGGEVSFLAANADDEAASANDVSLNSAPEQSVIKNTTLRSLLLQNAPAPPGQPHQRNSFLNKQHYGGGSSCDPELTSLANLKNGTDALFEDGTCDRVGAVSVLANGPQTASATDDRSVAECVGSGNVSRTNCEEVQVIRPISSDPTTPGISSSSFPAAVINGDLQQPPSHAVAANHTVVSWPVGVKKGENVGVACSTSSKAKNIGAPAVRTVAKPTTGAVASAGHHPPTVSIAPNLLNEQLRVAFASPSVSRAISKALSSPLSLGSDRPSSDRTAPGLATTLPLGHPSASSSGVEPFPQSPCSSSTHVSVPIDHCSVSMASREPYLAQNTSTNVPSISAISSRPSNSALNPDLKEADPGCILPNGPLTNCCSPRGAPSSEIVDSGGSLGGRLEEPAVLCLSSTPLTSIKPIELDLLVPSPPRQPSPASSIRASFKVSPKAPPIHAVPNNPPSKARPGPNVKTLQQLETALLQREIRPSSSPKPLSNHETPSSSSSTARTSHVRDVCCDELEAGPILARYMPARTVASQSERGTTAETSYGSIGNPVCATTGKVPHPVTPAESGAWFSASTSSLGMSPPDHVIQQSAHAIQSSMTMVCSSNSSITAGVGGASCATPASSFIPTTGASPPKTTRDCSNANPAFLGDVAPFFSNLHSVAGFGNRDCSVDRTIGSSQLASCEPPLPQLPLTTSSCLPAAPTRGLLLGDSDSLLHPSSSASCVNSSGPYLDLASASLTHFNEAPSPLMVTSAPSSSGAAAGVTKPASSSGLSPGPGPIPPGSPSSRMCCHVADKACRQRRINGYRYCIRHILLDPAAPYRQCAHLRKVGAKLLLREVRCTNPVALSQDSE